MDELKPCPFCGGAAERIDFGPGSGDNEGGSCIACTRCQASGPVEFGYKENFVSNWNRRTHPQPVTPAPERCDYCGNPLPEGCSTEFASEAACAGYQPVTPAGGEVEPRTDRQMLLYLDYQFAGEHWVCGRCGNEEATNGCDSHIALQRHLYTNPPVADAALVRDAERYRWWRENIDLLDQQSMLGIAYSCQIPVHNGHVPIAELMDMIADSQDAALNQRGGG